MDGNGREKGNTVMNNAMVVDDHRPTRAPIRALQLLDFADTYHSMEADNPVVCPKATGMHGPPDLLLPDVAAAAEGAGGHAIPRRVGHIRVVGLLGQGGMGAVYVGSDEKLQRKVALKAVRSEYRLNPHAKARLLREARILSQLRHPNICIVHDCIEGEENDFLVLELIEGRSLRAALDDQLSHQQKTSFEQSLDVRELVWRAARGETLEATGLAPDLTELIGRLKALAPGVRPSSVDALAQLQQIIDRPRRTRRRAAVAAVSVLLFGLSASLAVQSFQ